MAVYERCLTSTDLYAHTEGCNDAEVAVFYRSDSDGNRLPGIVRIYQLGNPDASLTLDEGQFQSLRGFITETRHAMIATARRPGGRRATVER